MRPFFVLACCLLLTVGVNAQTRPTDNIAAANEQPSPFDLLTFGGPVSEPGNVALFASGGRAARFNAFPGQGTDSYDRVVTQQMMEFDRLFRAEGLSRTTDVIRGGLDHGKSTSYTYRMTAGRVYGFAAVCDQDCSDLDLVLVNASGRTVKRDIARDDKPLITYQAEETGTYTLRVGMAQCSNSPCRFGLAVYQPTGSVSGSNAGSGGTDSYDRVVTQQMEAFDRLFRAEGLSRTSDVIRGGLNHGRQTEYTYRMTAGRVYGFAAVCDQDCSDLDLVLVNARGRTVKRDIARDDKPIISYRAEESGTYTLRVSMAQCSNSPCRFGLAVYQPTGSSGGVGSGVGSGGGESNRYDQMVTQQMVVFDRLFRAQGLSRTTDVIRGGLDHGKSTSYTYRMTAGRVYGFAAVCDQDCSDLDLVLVDGDGRVVKRDIARDDKPIISYRAEETGTYTLRVGMAQCSASPCRFGLAVYQPTTNSNMY